jgi:Condensation domain
MLNEWDHAVDRPASATSENLLLDEPSSASINQDSRLALDWLRRGSRHKSHFHIPLCLLLEGPLLLDTLERAINAVIRRHDSLRSVFAPVVPPLDLEPAIVEKFSTHDGWKQALFTQTARGNGGITLRVHDAVESGAATIITPLLHELIQDETVRPFDDGSSPPIRATVYRRSEMVHVLLVVVHHLVADGWSMRVLLHDLRSCYRRFAEDPGEPPPDDLPCSFSDHVRRQRTMLESPSAGARLAVWQHRYQAWAQHGMRLTDLPFLQRSGRPGPDRSGQRTLSLGSMLSQDMQRFCREHRATLYMLTMSALFVVCHLHSRKEQATVWSVLANRTLDTEPLIGWLSEGRIIGMQATPETTFETLLETVRDLAFELDADQSLPLSAIQHPTVRRPNRALFGPDALHVTMEVASRGMGDPVRFSASLRGVPLPVPYNYTLSGNAVRLRVEPGQVVRLRGIYSQVKLSGHGIQRLLRQLRGVIAQAVADPRRPLISFASAVR